MMMQQIKSPKPSNVVVIFGEFGDYEIKYENGFIKVYFVGKEIFDSKPIIEDLIKE
jgi:hypothetical protein